MDDGDMTRVDKGADNGSVEFKILMDMVNKCEEYGGSVFVEDLDGVVHDVVAASLSAGPSGSDLTLELGDPCQPLRDSVLLDLLDGLEMSEGCGWVLRESSSGRGWRLHMSTRRELARMGEWSPLHDTVRGAIASHMSRVQKGPS